jgi:hypothetical protein
MLCNDGRFKALWKNTYPPNGRHNGNHYIAGTRLELS